MQIATKTRDRDLEPSGQSFNRDVARESAPTVTRSPQGALKRYRLERRRKSSEPQLLTFIQERVVPWLRR